MPTEFYEYDGRPVRWEEGKYPKLVTSQGDHVLYDLEKFARESTKISEAEFEALKKRE